MVNGVLRSIDRSRAELQASQITDPNPIVANCAASFLSRVAGKPLGGTYGVQTTEAICAAGNEQPHTSFE